MLRELCRMHSVPFPTETESLSLPTPMDIMPQKNNDQASAIDDSDAEGDELEDATLESDPESEVDEDLSLDIDDGRNMNKVIRHALYSVVVVVIGALLLMRHCLFYASRRKKWIWNT